MRPLCGSASLYHRGNDSTLYHNCGEWTNHLSSCLAHGINTQEMVVTVSTSDSMKSHMRETLSLLWCFHGPGSLLLICHLRPDPIYPVPSRPELTPPRWWPKALLWCSSCRCEGEESRIYKRLQNLNLLLNFFFLLEHLFISQRHIWMSMVFCFFFSLS